MYCNNDWLYDNLCAKDSNDFDIDPISGENCFIIANNIGDSFMIKKLLINWSKKAISILIL